MLDLVAGQKTWIAHPWQYLLWVILGSLLIKVTMSIVRTIEFEGGITKNLFVVSKDDFRKVDYLVPTIVGTLELLVYPVLISLAAWQAVGGWLAIKTAAQWRWTGNAEAYTRFLLGNALVIFVSFLFARMVKS